MTCLWISGTESILVQTTNRFRNSLELVSEYEKKLEYAKKNTALPDEPDYKRIMEFTAYVNERVVKGEI